MKNYSSVNFNYWRIQILWPFSLNGAATVAAPIVCRGPCMFCFFSAFFLSLFLQNLFVFPFLWSFIASSIILALFFLLFLSCCYFFKKGNSLFAFFSSWRVTEARRTQRESQSEWTQAQAQARLSSALKPLLPRNSKPRRLGRGRSAGHHRW